MAICRKCGGDLDPDGTGPICMLRAALNIEPNPTTNNGESSIQSIIEAEPSEALEIR